MPRITIEPALAALIAKAAEGRYRDIGVVQPNGDVSFNLDEDIEALRQPGQNDNDFIRSILADAGVDVPKRRTN